MSARDELIEILDAKGPHHLFTSEEVADDILRHHAHELAEAIRAETRQLKADGVLEPDRFRPCRDAADQIDPESDRE